MPINVSPTPIARVCVYCGSSHGNKPAYARAARDLGTELARNNLGLVYGGGNVGIMGELSQAAFRSGAPVTGIIPQKLGERVGHVQITELIEVSTMHERKMLMFQKSDAFIAMPGGIGTMDELFETWTWLNLGFHAKPVWLLDIEGYWKPFFDLAEHMVSQGFLAKSALALLKVAPEPESLVQNLIREFRQQRESAL